MQLNFKTVGIVGTGAMGRGIAQLAAQAGSQVILYDSRSDACSQAQSAIQEQWARLQSKGRLSEEQCASYSARLQIADSMANLQNCDLVVEAIVERLDIKKQLFAELESIVGTSCVLASNTSSLSITAIAAGMQHAQRFA